jgi:hypothetical protein
VSDEMQAAILAAVQALTGAVEGLRADLKRREARDLEAAGRIPVGSTARAGNATQQSGAVFPGYGRRKGEPVAGAPMGDLEYYLAGCERTLNDPEKSRFHAKERTLKAAIEAEIARQMGSAPKGNATTQALASDLWNTPDATGPGDDDIPF